MACVHGATALQTLTQLRGTARHAPLAAGALTTGTARNCARMHVHAQRLVLHRHPSPLIHVPAWPVRRRTCCATARTARGGGASGRRAPPTCRRAWRSTRPRTRGHGSCARARCAGGLCSTAGASPCGSDAQAPEPAGGLVRVWLPGIPWATGTEGVCWAADGPDVDTHGATLHVAHCQSAFGDLRCLLHTHCVHAHAHARPHARRAKGCRARSWSR